MRINVKVKGLGNEDVDRRLEVRVAPELEDLQVLFPDPLFANAPVGKLLNGHWQRRSIAQTPQGKQRPPDIVGLQLHDQIDILGKAEIAVGIYREAAGHQIADVCPQEGPGDGFKLSRRMVRAGYRHRQGR